MEKIVNHLETLNLISDTQGIDFEGKRRGELTCPSFLEKLSRTRILEYMNILLNPSTRYLINDH